MLKMPQQYCIVSLLSLCDETLKLLLRQINKSEKPKIRIKLRILKANVKKRQNFCCKNHFWAFEFTFNQKFRDLQYFTTKCINFSIHHYVSAFQGRRWQKHKSNHIFTFFRKIIYLKKNMATLPNTDCYFYYYSTCTKGDSCQFRHEPLAMNQETECRFWKLGKCATAHCMFR